ncbi:MAG: DUF1499 domain-containing protein [Planctomycetaceae bacterium]|nr:DUF1499 domain-containing protein [Planctomycetaceae bacterium]
MRQKILWAVAAAVISPLVLRWVVRLASPRPTNLGVTDGRLAPCPKSPNCVSTQAEDAEHAIAPLTFEGDPAAAFERLRSVVAALPRTKPIAATDRYRHYEFTTLICGYIDDVEFVLDAGKKQIQFRSASRLGHSDLGANRKRMEAIRRAYSP